MTVGLPVTPVPASSGLEVATGEAAGEATGEGPGETAGEVEVSVLVLAAGELTEGEGTKTGEGLEGQRPQVAAQ